ncbi:MAG: hypothetical protein AABW64_03865 [Nanoarchaeota archaeon]
MNLHIICSWLALVVLLSAPALLAQSFPEKQVYNVEVIAVSISSVDLTCASDVTALVTVKNTGTLDAIVSAAIVRDDLEVDSFSPSIRVFAGEQQTIPLPFSLEKTTQGAYTFDVRLYTERGIREYLQSFSFAGCKKPQLTSLILSSSEQLDPSLFTQPSSVLAVEQQPRFSLHLLITLLLLGVLASLSLIFLVCTFLRERFGGK